MKGNLQISGDLLEVRDEGTTQGRITAIDFVGASVTVTTSGNIATVTITDSVGTPGGSDTQVQFNDSSAFGGDAGLTFDKTNDILSVGARLRTGDGSAALPAIAPTSDTNSGIYFGGTTTDTTFISAGGTAVVRVDTVGLHVGGQGGGSAPLNILSATETILAEFVRSSAGATDTAQFTIAGSASGTSRIAKFILLNAGAAITGAPVANLALVAPPNAGGGGVTFSALELGKVAASEAGYADILIRNSAGTLASRVFVDGDGNVGLGTSSPGAKLEIGGQVKITGGVPGSGKVLTSDADGLATWETSGSGSPGGSDTQVQFNDSSAFGGDAGLTFDKTNDNLALGEASFGTGAVKVFAIKSGTAPSTSPADVFQMYSADVVAGNAVPHFRTEIGTTIKLFRSSAYTPTNVIADRSYDANSTTIDELADVLGTLIVDLQATGLIG